jgi:hypothetical protein
MKVKKLIRTIFRKILPVRFRVAIMLTLMLLALLAAVERAELVTVAQAAGGEKIVEVVLFAFLLWMTCVVPSKGRLAIREKVVREEKPDEDSISSSDAD